MTREKCDNLLSVADKILLCFPDDDDPQDFVIPYYIIEELRAAVVAMKESRQ